MFGAKKRRRKRLRETPLPPEAAATLERRIPYLGTLSDEDRRELDGLVQVFLDEKWFSGTVMTIFPIFGQLTEYKIRYDDKTTGHELLAHPAEVWEILSQPAPEPAPKRQKLSLSKGKSKR